ncbi:MAG: YihY/virulence factor BrkB family protein [Bacteroidota bacterium]|nr:YihY/virulence factor BrkB family protein [Bacteroidota bacterium]
MKRNINTAFKNTFDSTEYYIKNFFRHLFDDELLFLASGISFNGVLCLIPILLLFTSLFGIVLNSSELGVQKIQEILAAAFPNQPYAQNIKNSIQTIIKDIIEYRTSFGIAGIAILTWTATSLFSSMRTALNRVYKIKSSKLMILTILEDFLWVLVVGVLFLVIIVSTWIYSLLTTLMHTIPGFSGFEFMLFDEALPFLLTVVLAFIMFLIVYRFIPDVAISWRTAIISSITATILWLSAAKLFAWYLETFHSLSILYGTYAFLFVLLIWIYYSSIVFIIGGIVGQLYRERNQEQKI